MEWSERLNSAIEYIEDNLTGVIVTEVAADKALCSSFHFQRIFYVVIGITLGEYIRRRRLTLAATELSSGNSKVIDVALKYGYESPEAFTRAFRHIHGITPQAARESGAPLVAYPRVSFHISIEGGI
ncbi:MAG: helix-turn-helix domain-containing protein, partial [Deltaproteobacteria bacterium]|nr:helix-turn-helix domain-containing protein [Deltaproteobacteria bacterium]